jgi:hypothetical protein
MVVVVMMMMMMMMIMMMTIMVASGGRQRYQCTTRQYRDNLKGVSFEGMLSYGPIDVVYTWVNGSDPRWLAKKKHYER